MSKKGVLAGVGALLFAQAGALAYYEEYQISKGCPVVFSEITGTSAGACNGAFIATGYSVLQRENIIFNLDPNTFLDYYLFSPLSLLTSSMALMAGDKLYKKLKSFFPGKMGDTLIPLTITATDIDNKKLVVFSSKTTPDMEVAKAVRMSMGLPCIFKPVLHNGFKMVDGGITKNFFIDNYPKDDPDVVGFRVYDNNDFDPVTNTKDMLNSLLFTAILQNEKDSKKHNNLAKYFEFTSDFDMFDFKKLNKRLIQKLYLDGYSQMKSLIGR